MSPVYEAIGPMAFSEVFERAGFVADWSNQFADPPPAYLYDFRGLRLTISQQVNQYLRPVYLCFGHWKSERSFGEVSYQLPLTADSYDQGCAWIVYAVKSSGFESAEMPDWYQLGLDAQGELPWKERQRAYEARPHCSVESEWFRLAAKKLRAHAETAEDSELAAFSFDGEALRISAGALNLVLAASGAAWPVRYSIRSRSLEDLPRRISGPFVPISVWEGRLTVGNRGWEIA